MTITYHLRTASHYRRTFEGSPALFTACWRQYRVFLRGDIDDPTCDDDVMDWLDQIAAERVNTPASRFYIYG
jgi:hypothetical protein